MLEGGPTVTVPISVIIITVFTDAFIQCAIMCTHSLIAYSSPSAMCGVTDIPDW